MDEKVYLNYIDKDTESGGGGALSSKSLQTGSGVLCVSHH